jgi:hypothetical protein
LDILSFKRETAWKWDAVSSVILLSLLEYRTSSLPSCPQSSSRIQAEGGVVPAVLMFVEAVVVAPVWSSFQHNKLIDLTSFILRSVNEGVQSYLRVLVYVYILLYGTII